MSTLGGWWAEAPWPSLALTPDARAAILKFGLGLDPVQCHVAPEQVLTSRQQSVLAHIARRYQTGEPLAYILGHAWFYGLCLRVTPAVLIPRPETECLVEAALACVSHDQSCRVIDVCTGSGAVALALKASVPNWSMTGRDICPDALAVARANGESCGLEVDWQLGSWLEGASGCDLLVANPPYIACDDPLVEDSVVAFEPHLALYAEESGLLGLRVLLEQGREVLSPGGWIVLEHGPTQAAALKDRADRLGYSGWRVTQDLAGRDRVSLGYWKG